MGLVSVLALALGCGTTEPVQEENPNRFDDRPPAECLAAPDCNRTMVCAHRGFRLYAPENTLAAVADAIELGVDFVEIDVRHTADDYLVVMHDSTVDRTTNGTGDVSSMTLAEIQALEVRPLEGEEVRPDAATVPTLEDVLALTMGHVVVDIDMKTHRGDLVATVLYDAGAEADVVVHKSDPKIAEDMLAIAPDLSIMPNLSNSAEMSDWLKDIPLYILETDGDLAGNVPEDLVEPAHEQDIKVFHDVLGLPDVSAALTDDPQYWKASAAAGADVLQTDYPHLLLPYLDEIGYR